MYVMCMALSTDIFNNFVLRNIADMVMLVRVKTIKDIKTMPRKGGRQTPQERRFIGAYVATGDATAAARAAGYAQPHSAAHNALERPAIRAEIVKLQTERLFNEVLPLAVDVHIALLTGKDVPAGAKAQAVKLAYDRTVGLQDPDKRREPHEMTAEELAEEIQALKRVASDKAALVLDGQARRVPDPDPLA